MPVTRKARLALALAAAFALLPLLLMAAATYSGDHVFSGGRVSFGTGGILQPPQGTSLPVTCTVGDVFFKTDATAGQNQYGCTATDTWTLQGGAGGGAAPVQLFQVAAGFGNTSGNYNTAVSPGGCFSASGAPAGASGGTNLTAGVLIFDDASTEAMQCRPAALPPAGVAIDDVTIRFHGQQVVNETSATATVVFEWACWAGGAAVETSPTWESAVVMTNTLTGGLSGNKYILWEATGVDLTEGGANDCAAGAFWAYQFRRGTGTDPEFDTSTNSIRSYGWDGWAVQ